MIYKYTFSIFLSILCATSLSVKRTKERNWYLYIFSNCEESFYESSQIPRLRTIQKVKILLYKDRVFTRQSEITKSRDEHPSQRVFTEISETHTHRERERERTVTEIPRERFAAEVGNRDREKISEAGCFPRNRALEAE